MRPRVPSASRPSSPSSGGVGLIAERRASSFISSIRIVRYRRLRCKRHLRSRRGSPPARPSELDVSRLVAGLVAHLRADPTRGRARGHARRARAGHHFLDDARYNDETGTAPIPAGYSEVLFGELFRAAGWDAPRRSSPTSCGGSSGPSRARRGARRLARADGFRLRRRRSTPCTAPEGSRSPSWWRRSPGWSRPARPARGHSSTGRRSCCEAARDREHGRRPLPCAAQLPYSLVQRA